MKIEQGKLLEVRTDSFYTSGEHNPTKRPIKLMQYEIIEIRYPYAWHFRTMDNHYFHATEEMIEDNCMPFGTILEEVRFGNRANLTEIIRLRLYKGSKEAPHNGNNYQLLQRQGFNEEDKKEILDGKKDWYVLNRLTKPMKD